MALMEKEGACSSTLTWYFFSEFVIWKKIPHIRAISTGTHGARFCAAQDNEMRKYTAKAETETTKKTKKNVDISVRQTLPVGGRCDTP